MRKFVLFTGIFNLLFGFALLFPFGVALALPKDSPGMTTHLFGITAAFLGVLLILSSRDLERFGLFVILEGILRIIGFAVFTFYVIFGDYGLPTLVLGLFDGLIGIIYIVGINMYLKRNLPKTA